MKYEIKNTDFGPNFYDADEDRDLTLEDVLVLLNDRTRLAAVVRAWEREYPGADLGARLKTLEER